MVSAGIDPSINSTGVCIMECAGTIESIKTFYYIVGNKPKKSTANFIDSNQDKFGYIDYGKVDASKEKEYYKKELLKTENILKSAEALNDILTCACPDIAVMEGVSYGSTSGASIVDLAGLNFVYRTVLIDNVCDDMVIASPMEIKKFATGNGGVDKDIMIRVWSLCEKLDIDPKAKVDDLADAYFMALYGVCKWYPELEKSLEIPKVEIPKRTKKKKKNETTDESIIENFTSIDESETDIFTSTEQ